MFCSPQPHNDDTRDDDGRVLLPPRQCPASRIHCQVRIGSGRTLSASLLQVGTKPGTVSFGQTNPFRRLLHPRNRRKRLHAMVPHMSTPVQWARLFHDARGPSHHGAPRRILVVAHRMSLYSLPPANLAADSVEKSAWQHLLSTRPEPASRFCHRPLQSCLLSDAITSSVCLLNDAVAMCGGRANGGDAGEGGVCESETERPMYPMQGCRCWH
mmetsp:Transcript_114883/g.228655  ORF Transcript_114883/g.228655 Transcript_114883/m.228655 type:complete len:213 (+) Transcript_114883:1965-2603(+)